MPQVDIQNPPPSSPAHREFVRTTGTRWETTGVSLSSGCSDYACILPEYGLSPQLFPGLLPVRIPSHGMMTAMIGSARR
jgi:hypothetical protein